ncbi:hypothetical protein MNBD_GAMMA05-1278 [hydrothermal vent metagenome]|uniref:DUF4124 domain-containing protein n=1 Tax=hydrothermal vent metagenome TaxID=652676 RepID=A0A3B0XFA8_9ZZZZ
MCKKLLIYMNIINKILPFIILLTASEFLYADIYQCKNDNGTISFKDTECSSSESLINMQKEEIYILKTDNDATLSNEKKLKVLYEASKYGNTTRFVKVSVFEETDNYLILEVTGYFSGYPAGTMQFRVTPNIPWGYSGNVETKKPGMITAYTRISLNSSAKDKEKSDILLLQLWHYSPKNKASRLNILTVPFKKTWYKNDT